MNLLYNSHGNFVSLSYNSQDNLVSLSHKQYSRQRKVYDIKQQSRQLSEYIIQQSVLDTLFCSLKKRFYRAAFFFIRHSTFRQHIPQILRVQFSGLQYCMHILSLVFAWRCCVLYFTIKGRHEKNPKIKCHSAYIDVLRKFRAPIRGQIIFLRRIYPLPVKLRKQSDMITVYPGNVAIDFWISLGSGRLPAPNRRDMNKKHVLARLLFFMNISRC